MKFNHPRVVWCDKESCSHSLPFVCWLCDWHAGWYFRDRYPDCPWAVTEDETKQRPEKRKRTPVATPARQPCPLCGTLVCRSCRRERRNTNRFWFDPRCTWCGSREVVWHVVMHYQAKKRVDHERTAARIVQTTGRTPRGMGNWRPPEE